MPVQHCAATAASDQRATWTRQQWKPISAQAFSTARIAEIGFVWKKAFFSSERIEIHGAHYNDLNDWEGFDLLTPGGAVIGVKGAPATVRSLDRFIQLSKKRRT